MTNLVNIRARCYNIKESDKVHIQLLSGKIIPALSTTTSIISGFVVLDIIKYLSGNKNFSETNINIGINQYTRYKAFNPKVTHNNMFNNDYGMQFRYYLSIKLNLILMFNFKIIFSFLIRLLKIKKFI